MTDCIPAPEQGMPDDHDHGLVPLPTRLIDSTARRYESGSDSYRRIGGLRETTAQLKQ